MVAITLVGGMVIRATDHHPFWDASTKTFTYADALQSGTKLRTASGRLIRIARTHIYRADLTAYNLAISGIHTYYVLGGRVAVLVHNSACPSGSQAGAEQLQQRASNLNDLIPGNPDRNNTTAAIRMWDPNSGNTEVWIGINGDEKMPAAWALNPGEKFIQGSAGAHAEENIFAAMENDPIEWEPIEGGTSRSVCVEPTSTHTSACASLVEYYGMALGGDVNLRSRFGGRSTNGVFNTFWRP